jgi:hypothetical protein
MDIVNFVTLVTSLTSDSYPNPRQMNSRKFPLRTLPKWVLKARISQIQNMKDIIIWNVTTCKVFLEERTESVLRITEQMLWWLLSILT